MFKYIVYFTLLLANISPTFAMNDAMDPAREEGDGPKITVHFTNTIPNAGDNPQRYFVQHSNSKDFSFATDLRVSATLCYKDETADVQTQRVEPVLLNAPGTRQTFTFPLGGKSPERVGLMVFGKGYRSTKPPGGSDYAHVVIAAWHSLLPEEAVWLCGDKKDTLYAYLEPEYTQRSKRDPSVEICFGLGRK